MPLVNLKLTGTPRETFYILHVRNTEKLCMVLTNWRVRFIFNFFNQVNKIKKCGGKILIVSQVLWKRFSEITEN